MGPTIKRASNRKRVVVDFPKDIANHTVEIRLDSGVHRDLHFSKNGSSVHSFTLTTWPGFLCISGDMGCFVFRRLQDMFEFFRRDTAEGITINPSYWAEKLEAVERQAKGYDQFEEEIFFQSLLDRFEGIEEEDGLFGDATPSKIIAAMHEHRRELNEPGERECRAHWDDFKFEGFTFSDLWEVRGREYTYRFLWCLHAIVWGIEQYDKAKAEAGKKGDPYYAH